MSRAVAAIGRAETVGMWQLSEVLREKNMEDPKGEALRGSRGLRRTSSHGQSCLAPRKKARVYPRSGGLGVPDVEPTIL